MADLEWFDTVVIGNGLFLEQESSIDFYHPVGALISGLASDPESDTDDPLPILRERGIEQLGGNPIISQVADGVFIATGGNGGAKGSDAWGELAAGLVHDGRWPADLPRLED